MPGGGNPTMIYPTALFFLWFNRHPEQVFARRFARNIEEHARRFARNIEVFLLVRSVEGKDG
jgi:hypothetical protein